METLLADYEDYERKVEVDALNNYTLEESERIQRHSFVSCAKRCGM